MFEALIAGNIVDNIVIVIEMKNTNITSSYFISEGNVDTYQSHKEKHEKN